MNKLVYRWAVFGKARLLLGITHFSVDNNLLLLTIVPVVLIRQTILGLLYRKLCEYL